MSNSLLHEDEQGMGLIEIVVSMFLIALLAMAFLPLLVSSLTSTRLNTSVATANQLVSQQLEALRSVGTNCASVTSFTTTDPAPVVDDRGVALTIDRQLIGVCPTTFPGTVKVTVAVSTDGKVLSNATTLVLVKSAT
jgi:type II secretory pathway pseudopilin PulG